MSNPQNNNGCILHFSKLKPGVSEEEFKNFVRQTTPTFNVLRLRQTPDNSIIFAEVNFENEVTATEVMKKLRYSNSDISRELRVTRYLSHEGAAPCFLAKLNPEVHSADVHNAIEETLKMDVNFVHVPLRAEKEESHLNRGYAIVSMSSTEASEALSVAFTEKNEIYTAIAAKIGEFAYAPYKTESEIMTNYTNIYVKNLPSTFTYENAVELCEKLGGELKVIKDDKKAVSLISHTFKNGESRQWMVVGFANHESATKFMEAAKGYKVDDLEINVAQYYTPKHLHRNRFRETERVRREFREKYRDCNLIVHNIPTGMTSDDLKEIFAKFGEIVRYGMPKTRAQERDGKMHIQGFVQFQTPEVAKAAAEHFNNKAYADLEELTPFMKEADSKDTLFLVNVIKNKEERMNANRQQMSNLQAAQGMYAQEPAYNWQAGEGAAVAQPDELTIFESASEEGRREILGNKLYPKVEAILNTETTLESDLRKHEIPTDEACSMITGMLISLDWTPEKLPVFEELLSDRNQLAAQIRSGLELIIKEKESN